MAAASPETETDICNMSLGRIGSERLDDDELEANTSVLAKHCNLHYAQTRDSLIRSHWWRFAKARAVLTAADTPDFEWSYAFTLPTDFLRLKSFYEDNATIRKSTVYSYELEGNLLLTDESSCNLRYIKQVTTVTDFDPLFIEVFVLRLAMKLILPVAGAGRAATALYESIKNDLKLLLPRVRALDREEGETIGRVDRNMWNDARWSNQGRLDSKLGSA